MNRIEDEEQMTEEQWQAILQNDVAYNDIFFYAVKTTGIFVDPPANPKHPIGRMRVFFRMLNKRWLPDFVLAKDVNRQVSVFLIRNG